MIKITLPIVLTSLCFLSGITIAHADDSKSVPAPTKEEKANAQYDLGMLYLQGSNQVQQDAIMARKWITKAATQGYTNAQTKLGEMYITGQGISSNLSQNKSEDYKNAKEWLSKAAEKGDQKANYLLGSLYQDGKGVEKDTDKAFDYYQKAAEKGYKQAQTNIGSMYLLGEKPVTQDFNQAKLWFEKSASQGDQTAQNYLADIYRFGRGVPVDTNKAQSLYKKLCDEGQENACYTYKDIQATGK